MWKWAPKIWGQMLNMKRTWNAFGLKDSFRLCMVRFELSGKGVAFHHIWTNDDMLVLNFISTNAKWILSLQHLCTVSLSNNWHAYATFLKDDETSYRIMIRFTPTAHMTNWCSRCVCHMCLCCCMYESRWNVDCIHKTI